MATAQLSAAPQQPVTPPSIAPWDAVRRWCARAWYPAALALFALLYGLAFFQGLELHGAYPGNSFKAIHPESFPGDLFITGRQPTMVSLVYVVARLVGDLWLDDRFQLLLYIGLAWLAIAAVDRLAKLFGVERRLERLAIVALVVVAHHFKPSVFAQLVPSSGSPTAMIHPLGMWLAVPLLQGHAALAALGLGAVMGLTAVKNGWYPALMALVFSLRDRWGVSWRRITLWSALGLGAVFLVHVLAHRGSHEPALLFDWINWFEDGESNPFREPGAGNYFYAALLLAAIAAPSRSVELRRRCRAFFLIALIAFVGSGLYYTYAPDPLKIPLIQALAVNRANWWPQQLAYIILGCYALALFDRPSGRAKAWSVALMGTLYLLPVFDVGTTQVSGFFLKRAWLLAAVSGSLGVALFAGRLMRGSRSALSAKTAFLVLPIVLTTGLYLARCAQTQGPHLRFLLAHGVMGNSASAQWVGVDAYLRTKTPRHASVLALVTDPDGHIHVDWTLRTRAGRTMPVGHRTMAYLSGEKASWYFEQMQRWRAFGGSWDRRDWAGVSRELQAMGWPDYLVAPTSRVGWLRGLAGQPYAPDTVIGTCSILRRH